MRLPTPKLLLLQPLSPWILQDAYSEIAYLFAEFFRDLDIVPSDIIAGLVLLRQRQRAKRNAVLDEVGKPGNLFPAALGFPGKQLPTSFLDCSHLLRWERKIMVTSAALPEFLPVKGLSWCRVKSGIWIDPLQTGDTGGALDPKRVSKGVVGSWK